MGAMAWPFEDLRKLVPFLPADDGQQEAAMSPKIPPTELAERGIMKPSTSLTNLNAHGMRITFQNLTHTVPSNTEKNTLAYLLQGVSGFLQPGEMTALMGPSGSGKTTLLDILSGRKTEGRTEGAISFSGSTPSRAFLRRYTGYVEQFDTLLGILTVREMLLYTAELKRPMSEPLASKEAAVDELLQKLALESCAAVRIGSRDNKGISGGQAKRTNIGIALVTNPRVLFLDEPTSGLDSFTANEVMTFVKQLARDNVTLAATIHSPTQYCFELFDSLLMLVKGRAVFFGRTSEAVPFALSEWRGVVEVGGGRSSRTAIVGAAAITAAGGGANGNGAVVRGGGRGGAAGAGAGAQAKGAEGEDPRWQAGRIHNEAEWLVEIVTGADRAGQASALADAFDRSPQRARADAAVDEYLLTDHQEVPESVRKELATNSETVTPWWFGLKTLVKYRTPRNYKDPEFLGPRIGETITMTTLQWTLYWGVGKDLSPNNIVNISAVLFMWCVLPAYNAASYVPSIVLERTLYARERADGLYLPITYLLAKMLDELMLSFVTSVATSAAAFHAIDFRGSFALFWLVYILTLMIGIVLAYWIAAASPNMDVANAVLPAYVTILLFFGGFILDFNAMPPWWEWFSYADFLRYAWGALMVNQFDEVDPVWQNNRTVLQNYGLKSYSDPIYKWYSPDVQKARHKHPPPPPQYHNVGFMVLFFLVYFCLAWYVLATKNFVKR